MTINRTNVKPSFYIEIGGIDVSDFVVDRGTFTPTTKEKISTGIFQLDKSVDSIIVPKKFIQDVFFYVEIDNKYKRFGGIITLLKTVPGTNFYNITVKSFAWSTYQARFTGIFRADAGKGNRKTIITDILREKFPNVTWDNTTFPDIDSSFDILYKVYNNKKPGDIFDELLGPIDRDWWIDKDNVFYAQVRTYTQINKPVVYPTNTVGTPIIDINNNYANLVLVYGKTFEKNIPHIFSGTGTTDEFDLDFFPIGSADVQYSDGTSISVTMEGNDNYNDSTEYDAYFKQSEKKLKFNVNTVADTDNIIVNTRSTDQIRESVPSGSEIARIGIEIIKEIRNEEINTTDEAYQVGLNYLANYGFDQAIYLIGVNLDDDDNLAAWVAGNAVPITLNGNQGYQNIVEELWSFSSTDGLNLSLRFVDFERNDNDLIRELINKTNLKEQQVDTSTTNLTRFFYMGENIVINFQNFSLETQDASDYRFQLQENPALQDDRSLMSETGTIPAGGLGSGIAALMTENDYATAKSIISSINARKVFIDSFLDDWFFDSNESTSNLNLTTKEIEFTSGATFAQSRIVYTENTTILRATPEFSDTGTLQYELSADNGSNWETVTNNTEHIFTNTGLYLLWRAVGDIGSTITKPKISYVINE